jgi:hypothetical protein
VINDLDQRFQYAAQSFWDTRERQQQKQVDAGKSDAGTRGAVTGGTQMGELETLLTDVLLDAGLDQSHIRVRTSSSGISSSLWTVNYLLQSSSSPKWVRASETISTIAPKRRSGTQKTSGRPIGKVGLASTERRFSGTSSSWKIAPRYMHQSAIRSRTSRLIRYSRVLPTPSGMRFCVSDWYSNGSTAPHAWRLQQRSHLHK